MPYSALPDDAFWKLCRDSGDGHVGALYKPKFRIRAGHRVATAGSCFAQHFGTWVRRSDLEFIDMEPRPGLMTEEVGRRYGYGIYSARYGNLYTARQLRQLLDDCRWGRVREAALWQDKGRWQDGLRPQVEPEGHADRDEVIFHRKAHLDAVRRMVTRANLFVFTLGLTEAWCDRRSGTVFPMAPGVIAGQFDQTRHGFVNFTAAEVAGDLVHICKRLKRMNRRIRILLTVSPVPLTATASGRHVVQATTYSKAALRVAADSVAQRFRYVDYLPSYEIITNPMFGAAFYDPNLRTVKQAGVETVMSMFFGAHPDVSVQDMPVAGAQQVPDSAGEAGEAREAGEDPEDDLICEEALLEDFART